MVKLGSQTKIVVGLAFGVLVLVLNSLPVRAQILSERDTCTASQMTVGYRDGLMTKCFATFSNSVNDVNGVACTLSMHCCVDSSAKPFCVEPKVTYTPAVPSTTATTPKDASKVSTDDTKGEIEIKFELGIPGLLEAGKSYPISSTTIADYIRIMFVYFVWIVGIVAIVMVIYGGIRWIMAAGNASQINEARSIINNAIIGVIIALTSVVLLNIINPGLTNFRGLYIKYVDVEKFQDEVIAFIGPITPCGLSSVSGQPTDICQPNNTCVPQLNQYINTAATKWKVDPVLVKSIIMHESPKYNGNPKSGPTTLGDNTSSGRLGSAYGVGQFTAATLITVLPKVNGGKLPNECQASKAEQLRQTDGSLITSCANWLDQHLSVQVDMIAALLSMAITSTCATDDITRAILVYSIGGGNANAYCRGDFGALEKNNVTRQMAEKYLSELKAGYETMCSKLKS